MTIFAMIFPGQGSQTVGMLSSLAKHPLVEQTFSEASLILGYDLWRLIEQGPDNELHNTCRTQPAILTASVAIWRVWQKKNEHLPQVMAGHSLGEYSALVCSGSLDFATAIKLVSLRSQLMQEAVPIGCGAMSAIIGLDDDTVIQTCLKYAQDQIVSPVNFNAPGQVVIAGHKEAVERTSIACKIAGAKQVLFLPISIPSHCELMKPAAKKLAEALEGVELTKPRIPVVNNVDIHTEYDPINISRALVRQLYSPVYWRNIIEYLVDHSIEVVLEVGPGSVLTSLTKRMIINFKSIALMNSNPTSWSTVIK